MFDTMTLTKIGGGLFGSFLVYLLGAWAADSIYAAPVAHGEGEHAQAYVIEVAGAETHGAEETPAEDPVALFAAAFPAADAAAGGEIFGRRCASCHSDVAGENKTGPALHGVVGRAVGSVADFEGYSGALPAVFDVWTPENLNIFLLNPKAAVADTAMNYAGLEDVADRADLIAYLAGLDG